MFARAIARQTTKQAVRGLATETGPLIDTTLKNLHVQLGGKIVPFAGYNLPVEYEGTLKEHKHTRAEGCSSLFDVSHMGQIHFHGKDRVKFLERVVVGDIQSLKEGESKLTLIMNEEGCIVDDCVVTNAGDYIYMVANGAKKWVDMAHFEHYMKGSGLDVAMQYQSTTDLVALQGKGAKNVLSALAPALNLTRMGFMTSTIATVAGIDGCRVTRCGYTGEDGFEISCPQSHIEKLATAILAQPGAKPAGLGSRDLLRLEAGLCLCGTDFDDKTNPVEANLVWTIGGPKSRRRVEQGFLGASKILEKDGKLKPVTRKRVGFSGMKPPVRHNAEIFNADSSKQIGVITSGNFSPILNKPVAMGYVPPEFANEDTKVQINFRGKHYEAVVTKMPFVPTSYYRAV